VPDTHGSTTEPSGLAGSWPSSRPSTDVRDGSPRVTGRFDNNLQPPEPEVAGTVLAAALRRAENERYSPLLRAQFDNRMQPPVSEDNCPA